MVSQQDLLNVDVANIDSLSADEKALLKGYLQNGVISEVFIHSAGKASRVIAYDATAGAEKVSIVIGTAAKEIALN